MSDSESSPDLGLLDVVALVASIPEHGLHEGQIGTIVELFTDDAFEVEFCDENGRTVEELALYKHQMRLVSRLGRYPVTE